MPTTYEPSPFPYTAPGPSPSLPATGNFLKAVRSSCQEITEASSPDIITLGDDEEAAIDAFLQAIDPAQYEKLVSNGSDPLRVPLRFENLLAEINYVALLGYLQIGSGYRTELKAATGRGASESITFGMLSIFISGTQPNAEWLRQLGRREVAELLGLEYEQEVPHETLPGVYLMRKTEVAGLVDLVHFLLVDLGETLTSLGYRTFGHFVLDAAKAPTGERPSAAKLVEALVTNFKGLQDMCMWKNRPIYLFKKAQLIASDCYKAFRTKAPNSFDFKDIDQLTIFADNVVPTCLIVLGLMKVSPEIQDLIAKKADLGLPPEVLSQIDSRLRAAAVTVCSRIVSRAKETGVAEAVKGMTDADLDYYLWSLGKEPQYRGLTRPVNSQTYFY